MKKMKNGLFHLSSTQQWFSKPLKLVVILIALGLFSATNSVSAQNEDQKTLQITGTVVDNANSPLPGVNVLVKGIAKGSITDFDGKYEISNVKTGAVLVFSSVGMETKEVAVGTETVIDVTLNSDTQSLDEVVVIGYGSQSRNEVTGAISSVKGEKIASLPVATADQALQGRAAGVSVINAGSPGSGSVIRIRGLGTMGNNNPLYVVDGIITNGIGDLNPNDIKSINVLKDASTTAVYGSRGSNGVIMVTTKSGSKSEKVNITFNAYTGAQTITERYDLLNTDQYLDYALSAFDIVPTTPSSTSGVNTDWQDEVFQTGLMKNYDLALSGGGENSDFRFSAGYMNQEGAVIGTEYERYTFRMNSNFTLGKVKFGETLNISFNETDAENIGGGRSFLEHAIKSAPYLTVYNDANLGGFQGPNTAGDFQDAENPVRIQLLGSGVTDRVNVAGSIFGEWEIIEDLKFKSQVGLDYRSSKFNAFSPAYDDDSEGATHARDFAIITKNTVTAQAVILTNSLNYEKTFDDVHNFELLLLSEESKRKTSILDASSQNDISDEIEQLSDNGASVESKSFETNRIGYLARLNYNFDEKYIFSASYRRDATSRFGANNRWGNFPSVAAGWNISKENFMKDSNFSNLKLRGSWGIVGNDQIGDYQYTTVLNSNFVYPIDGSYLFGTTANGLGNSELKWEETTMKNIGLDFGLFDEKITGSLEYFNNRSDDLLMNRTLPLSSGFFGSTVAENVGSVKTNGFEATLAYNDDKGDFTWGASFNIGTSKNEVISLGTTEELTGGLFEGNDISRISVGESLFYFYGLEMDGIYQTQAEVDAVLSADIDGVDDGITTLQTTVQPGDVKFIDHNGDGEINADDRVQIGNPHPDLTYGFTADFAYKDFDLSLFINGVSGNDIYNTNKYDLEGMTRLFNAGTSVLNRWTGEGTSNTIPRSGGAPQNTAISSRFVEDGSFTRLKNITIGYTLTDKLKSDTISKLRLYVSAQNLITLTNYSGLDPEIGNFNKTFDFGIDRGYYPQPKSFIVGVQLSF